MGQFLPQPVGVRMLAGQLRLDLPVVDNPSLGRVNQEDPSRVEPFLDQDVLRRDVEHAHLGRHHHQIVLRHDVARGAEAVPVEDRADHRPVGERDRRRPVPRFHQRSVILVERLSLRVHRLVVAPRLRDHHQHRVGERATRQREELQHVVERRRIALPLADQREQLLQVVVAERLGAAERLARPHPVDVAAQRIDLAVVRDVAVRVGQRP